MCEEEFDMSLKIQQLGLVSCDRATITFLALIPDSMVLSCRRGRYFTGNQNRFDCYIHYVG
jgi:hypothetical protein